MQIVRYNSLIPSPWKNGGGVTREAICVPAGAERFDWRVSFAQIDSSGPFSDFSGYGRYMVLLRGAGVRLEFAGGKRTTLRKAGDLAHFDGAIATHGSLVDGSCIDLNLIVSKALQATKVRVMRVSGTEDWPALVGQLTLAIAIDGDIAVEDVHGESVTLAQWDLAAGNLRSVFARSPSRVFIAGIVDNRTTHR